MAGCIALVVPGFGAVVPLPGFINAAADIAAVVPLPGFIGAAADIAAG